jgi:hypothetical protein
MKHFDRRSDSPRRDAFSLVEVVLALGVVSFAIVAILGVFPVGLSLGHSAQDETRAPQIAQSIFGALAAQNLKRVGGQPELDGNGHLQLNNAARIPSVAGPIDLTSSADVLIYARNDGTLSDSDAGATYAITIRLNNAPAGFEPSFANQVTVSIGWPALAPVAARTTRDFVRIISKY